MAEELLNTLYLHAPGTVARLEGDHVRVEPEEGEPAEFPLQHLDGIILFGGAVPTVPLLLRMAHEGREAAFLDMAGRLKARMVGPQSGSVLLRMAQFQAAAQPHEACEIARDIVAGKIAGQRQILLRGARDTTDQPAQSRLQEAADTLAQLLQNTAEAPDTETLRGLEGQSAAVYFSVFGNLLRRPPAEFTFTVRSRRPPRDRANALLSFLYSLITVQCTGAVEAVGLDPEVGFLHDLRSGRPSLGLDLVEEFRAPIADRLALNLINRRQLNPDDFENQSDGAVLLNRSGRHTVLTEFRRKMLETTPHPLREAPVPVGLLPHIQAKLLARRIRGEDPAYKPYVPR